MATCSFITCTSNADKGSAYCVRHKKLYGNGVVVSVQKEIAKQSDQTKEDNKRLAKEYKVFLAKPGNKKCKAKLNGCTKDATVVHHKKGRIGEIKFDQCYWMPCCPNCNGEIERLDALAREKGLKLSKFTPDEDILLASGDNINGQSVVIVAGE